MAKYLRGMCLLGLPLALVSCEKLKEKEIAQLPATSEEDTLVLGTDTYYQDTFGVAQSQTNQSAGTLAETESSAEEEVGENASIKEETKAAPTPAMAEVKRKVYRKPTKAQLQKELAKDARLSERMSLQRLKRYWQHRQQYYRKATKEVKYVSGETKININPEETKIETPKGKVKIEGRDIKVKAD